MLATKIVFFMVISALAMSNIFNPIIKTSIVPDIVWIDYSLDQRFLAYVTKTYVQLSDGVSIYLKQRLFPLGYQITCFGFSRSSQWYALGLRNKQDNKTIFALFNYHYDYGQNEKQIYASPKTNYRPKSQQYSRIISLCFTSDNMRLIYGTENGQIFVYNLFTFTQQSIQFQPLYRVESLACSDTNKLEFAALGNLEGNLSMVKIYMIEDQTNIPKLVKDVDTIVQGEKVRSIYYSGRGNLYRAGTKIYKINKDIYTQELVQYNPNFKEFVKIRVSSQQNILVASTLNNQIYIRKLNQSNGYIQQNKTAISGQFGLSTEGGTMFFLENPSMGTLLSQCRINQYLNVTDDQCYKCNSQCRMCLDSSSTCRLCNQSYFLTNTYQCLPCVSRCRLCSNSYECGACYFPFIKQADGSCRCEQGKFIDGSQCSNCIEYCKQCQDNHTCLTCNANFTRQGGQCLCSKGKYLSQQFCLPCSQHCLQCKSETLCQTCEQNYNQMEGICKKSFPTFEVIAIIVIGVTIILVSSIFIIKRCRKIKKESMLGSQNQSDHEYQLKD